MNYPLFYKHCCQGYLLVIAMVMVLVRANAQCSPNLVPNPGFETGACGIPKGTFLDLYSVNNVNQEPTLDHWHNPTNATPDWFNSCTNSVSYSPPVTSHAATYNIQDTRAGSTAHAGFLSYGDTEPRDNVKADYREYLQVQLDAPLLAGARYNVSFYVNLAAFETADVEYTSNTAYFNYNFRIFGTDKIGAFFSNGPITDYNMDPLDTVIDVEPQIEYVGAPITEVNDWILVNGSFIAAGGEEYMTIGNFRNNSETNFELVRNASTEFGKYPDQIIEPIFQIAEYAYYLLDDISVVQEPVLNAVDAGADVSVNAGDAYTFSIATTGLLPTSYSWSPATTLNDPTLENPTASPKETTVYTVTVDFGDGCPVSDQITVTVVPCPLNIDLTNVSSGYIDCNLTETDITGIVVANASASATYTWTDAYGNVVGDRLILEDVGIGQYDLLVSDGPNCQETISWAIDGDQSISFLEYNVFQVCPTPGNSDGYISGIIGFPVGGTYAWTDENGTNLGSGAGIIDLGPGVYTVTYTTGASGSCSIRKTFDLTENGICSDNCPGLISVTPYADNDRDNVGTFFIDLGDTVSLYPGIRASVTASADFSWSTPGNPDFHPFQILSDISPTETTTYTIAVDYGNGCIRSGTITVVVNDPGCPLQVLDGTIVSSSCGADNGGVRDITVLNGVPGETYTWTDENGTVVSNSLALDDVGQGQYTLLIDQGGGCTRSRTWEVPVSDGYDIDAGPDVAIDFGNSSLLEAIPSGGTPVSYNWSPATGLDDVTLANPTASPTTTTTYTVTADFGGGCTDTDTVTVNVNQLVLNCSGNNLVPNPDLESTSGCPQGFSTGFTCNQNDPNWQYQNNLCFVENWFNEGLSTPDLISISCADTMTGTDNTARDYKTLADQQNPRSGQVMGGIITYNTANFDPNENSYSEYYTVALDATLQQGIEYSVVFYCSLSEVATIASSIGAHFSEDPVRSAGFNTFVPETPQIVSEGNVTDTTNWVRVSGTFTAQGNERYMTIGRFLDGYTPEQVQNTEPVITNGEISAYYYIDDVSVTATLNTIIIDAGTDVSLDLGDSIVLQATPTGGTPISYSWSPATGLDNTAIANPTASPTITTTYTVTADFGGECSDTDTVTVTVIDPNCPLMLSGGNSVQATCKQIDGGILGINVTGNSGNERYSWTDANGIVVGAQLDLANVGLGNYTLTVTDNPDCERVLSFTVNESGPPDLDDATLELTDAGCAETTGSIGGIVYIGETVGTIFTWTDAQGAIVGNTLELDGIGAGSYSLAVTDALGCGAIAGPYTIGSPEDCEDQFSEEGPVRIANTMTPNGDGANDMFYIEGIAAYPNSILKVYNRWGNKVYEKRGYANNWYGNYQGTPLPVGTYYYTLQFGNPDQKNIKGYIALLK